MFLGLFLGKMSMCSSSNTIVIIIIVDNITINTSYVGFVKMGTTNTTQMSKNTILPCVNHFKMSSFGVHQWWYQQR